MGKLYSLIFLLLLVLSGCSKDENPILPSTGTISGTITAESTSLPLQDVDVTTIPVTKHILTDQAGKYSITEVNPGMYTVKVVLNGYINKIMTVEVKVNETSHANFALATAPPDPVAGFTYTGDTVSLSPITFQNISTNADSYHWEFGDNTSSVEENPVHTYNVRGTYTVKLKARFNGTGKENVYEVVINIMPSKVFMYKTIVEQIPETKESGQSWDPGSGDEKNPDVYCFGSNTGWGWMTQTANNLKTTSLPVSLYFYVPGPGRPEVSRNRWDTPTYFYVFDVDDNMLEELMGQTQSFKISDLLDGYKTEIPLQSSNGKVKIRVFLLWE